MKELICISCPLGCNLTVDDSDLSDIKVTGNTCPRGVVYAKDEVTAPKRTVTASCRVIGGNIPMVSVKTDNPIPKELIFSSLDELNKVTVTAPVKVGDIIVCNILNTGVNFVATKSIKKV